MTMREFRKNLHKGHSEQPVILHYLNYTVDSNRHDDIAGEYEVIEDEKKGLEHKT